MFYVNLHSVNIFTNFTKNNILAKHHTKASKRKFLKIYEAMDGHISKSVAKFGITRRTFYDWCKEDWFKQEVDDIDEKELDDAEEMARLMRKGVPKYLRDDKGELILDKDKKAIITGWIIEPSQKMVAFYLERKGIERGYGKTQTLKHEMNNMPEAGQFQIGVKVNVRKNKKNGK